MMKARRDVFAFLCLSLMTMLVLTPAWAQKSEPPPPEALQNAAPKDNHTRAKMHTELGSIYFQSGNVIVALEELSIAISIDDNYAPAYSTRALALLRINELASAEKDFKRALSLDAKNPEINNNYGWFLCQIGREKDSFEYFQSAIKNPLYQTPERAYLSAGGCYIQVGELDIAEDYVRKSMRLLPDQPQALYELARISYKRGNYDAARKFMLDANRLAELGPEQFWLFIRIERRLGNKTAEESLTTQFRRKFPESNEYQALLKGDFQ